jgi:DNA-directed RNA polymerase subunit M/transcription elongation factor TFIIS
LTEKEMRKLSRTDLLQMLIDQGEELKALKENLEEVKTQQEELENEDVNESVVEDTHKTANSEKCPECGDTVRFEGGCVICPSCGWSKCN